MRIADIGLGRSRSRTRDLVALLLCHGARAWRSSQPKTNLRLSVSGPDDRPAVRHQRRDAGELRPCAQSSPRSASSRRNSGGRCEMPSSPFAHVRRGVLALQVAPALERAPRLPARRMQHRLENEVAARNAVGVDERSNVQKALAHLHVPLDHPVERAALQQFVRPLGDHARGVELLGDLAAGARRIEARGDPGIEILDRLGADAEFEKVQGHGWVIGRSVPRSSRRTRRSLPLPQPQHSTTLTARPPVEVSL